MPTSHEPQEAETPSTTVMARQKGVSPRNSSDTPRASLEGKFEEQEEKGGESQFLLAAAPKSPTHKIIDDLSDLFRPTIGPHDEASRKATHAKLVKKSEEAAVAWWKK